MSKTLDILLTINSVETNDPSLKYQNFKTYEAEFKEFEPRLEFKEFEWLVPLKILFNIQDLSWWSIKTGFWRL